MARIDYFLSLLSPFTYLAGMRLEEIAAKHGAEIVYRPADIQAVFAETGGVPVPQRHPFRQEYRLQELARLSTRSGLPLNIQPAHWPTNAAPASCAVIAVAAQGGDAGAVAHAFLRAVWAEERDIADPDVVADVLSAHGLDVGTLAEAIKTAEAQFAENKDLAIANGVFGAPFYVIDGERFWGQDRLDYLDWYLGKS